jgi:hypothetical protein
MARVFTCGFEENNTGSDMWQSLGTTQSIGTTNARSGTYAARCNGTSAAAFFQCEPWINALTSGTVFQRGYIRVVTNPTADAGVMGFRSNTDAKACQAGLSSATGKLFLQNNITSTSVNAASALSANTWYRLELKIVLSDTVGSAELKYFLGDSTTATETLNINSEDTLPVNIFRAWWGVTTTNNTHDLYFDDVCVNDATGAFQNDYPGPGKTAFVEPASDVAVQWSDETSGAATFANINNLPGANDDTSYNKEATTLNHVDQFGISTMPAEVTSDATMHVIQSFARCGSNQTTTCRMKLRIWDDAASTTDSTEFNVALNGWCGIGSNPTKVQPSTVDLTGKSKSAVQTFNLGYINTTDSTALERRVSEMWANIEWLETPASPSNLGDYAGEFKILRPTYW